MPSDDSVEISGSSRAVPLLALHQNVYGWASIYLAEASLVAISTLSNTISDSVGREHHAMTTSCRMGSAVDHETKPSGNESLLSSVTEGDGGRSFQFILFPGNITGMKLEESM